MVTERAWERLFAKYGIAEQIAQNGFYSISASQIKEFREPRLMAKFDHAINRPLIFQDGDLAILPTSRGTYTISQFQAYHELETLKGDKQRVFIPDYLQSLSLEGLVSESIALNCAYSCGILNDFLEEETIYPTVSGRMGSGDFSFTINGKNRAQNIRVQNAQIEIDGAYEGVECLALFEVKSSLSQDFIIRQLYYPFRTWRERVKKPIKSVFLTYSNGVFNLYLYRFDNPQNYNSIRIEKQKSYVIGTKINLSTIENLLKTIPVTIEPALPFPQANSMEKIINLIELLHNAPMEQGTITEKYGFDPRQTNYYADAGRYLGLVDRESGNHAKFKLSEIGQRVVEQEYTQRQLSIAGCMLEHKVFRDVLRFHLEHGKMPDKADIVKIMKGANLHNIEADTTYARRATTVSSWVNWILGLIDNDINKP
jgi:hypothetical protein